jgi:hypothetical protein
MARVFMWWCACVYTPLVPPLIFIEHANGRPRRRPISTIIWLGSNPAGLNLNCYDCLLGISPTEVSSCTSWPPLYTTLFGPELENSKLAETVSDFPSPSCAGDELHSDFAKFESHSFWYFHLPEWNYITLPSSSVQPFVIKFPCLPLWEEG